MSNKICLWRPLNSVLLCAAVLFLLHSGFSLACEGSSGAMHQCASQKKAGHHQVQVVETDSGRIEMKISGMACSSCVKKLEAALKAVKGVKSAVVSLEKKVAHIEVTDPSLRKELELAAASAGFTPM